MLCYSYVIQFTAQLNYCHFFFRNLIIVRTFQFRVCARKRAQLRRSAGSAVCPKRVGYFFCSTQYSIHCLWKKITKPWMWLTLAIASLRCEHSKCLCVFVHHILVHNCMRPYRICRERISFIKDADICYNNLPSGGQFWKNINSGKGNNGRKKPVLVPLLKTFGLSLRNESWV